MVNNKILLRADQLPRKWYNVAADIKDHLVPPLDPSTGQPMDPAKLSILFAEALIEQEVSTERWIDIPEPVLDQYTVFRPTMLVRARQLEEYLGTPARIYYKNEGTSPPGSHKTNTAIPQAFYNKQEGIKRLTTETGGRPMGFGPFLRVQQIRDRTPGLHGPLQLRAKAVSEDPDADVGLQRPGFADRSDRVWPGHPGPIPGYRRLPRHRHLRGRRGRPQTARHPLHPRQRPQPRHAPSDGHRTRTQGTAQEHQRKNPTS